MTAQRGLGYSKLRSGLGEVRRFTYCQKISQMPEFDGSSLFMPKRHGQLEQYSICPVQRIDGKLCVTERGSTKKHYEQARRCDTRRFSCGLDTPTICHL